MGRVDAAQGNKTAGTLKEELHVSVGMIDCIRNSAMATS